MVFPHIQIKIIHIISKAMHLCLSYQILRMHWQLCVCVCESFCISICIQMTAAFLSTHSLGQMLSWQYFLFVFVFVFRFVGVFVFVFRLVDVFVFVFLFRFVDIQPPDDSRFQSTLIRGITQLAILLPKPGWSVNMYVG